MFVQKLRTFAMAKAKEDHVDLIKGQFVGKPQIGLAIYAFVHVTEEIAGITCAVDETDIGFGMTQKNTYQFTCGITGATDNTNSNHAARC